MAVESIFRKYGQKVGLKASDSVERQIIADVVNEAARALYNEAEIPHFVKELSGDNAVEATPDGVLILPSEVFLLRAMRETDTRLPWTLRDVFAKYQEGTLVMALWFSWVVIGHRPLAISMSAYAASTITVQIGTADATVMVTITGSTATAEQTSETLTMDAVSKTTTKSFTKIFSITKNITNSENLTIKAGVNTIATLKNNLLETSYLHVDVSKYPSSTIPLNMDVLYKEALPYLFNDNDIFADGTYDDVLLNRAIGQWAEDNDKLEEAILRDRKASRELARRMSNEDRGKVQLAKFVAHSHDNLVYRHPFYRRNFRRV